MADDNKIIVDLIVKGVEELKKEMSLLKEDIDKLKLKFTDFGKDEPFKNPTTGAKTLTQQLRGLTSEISAANLELAEMKDAGKQGTAEFSNLEKKIVDLTKKAGNLKDAIGDANQVISQAGSDTAGLDKAIRAVGTATAAFQVFEGAAVLAGKGNEDLQKALVKLNAVMAITQGLQQIQNELTRNDSVFKGIAAKATAAYNLVVGQSTGALKLFRIALAATGIGLLVIAIGTLVTNWDKFTSSIRNSFPALDGVIKFFENIRQFGAGTIAGIVEGFSVLGEVVSNIFKGQFSQAVDVAKDFGKRTAQAYNNAYAEEDEKVKIEQSLEQRKLNASLLEAQGKDTLAIRLKIAQDELRLLDKTSKEYSDKLIEIEQLKYKIIKEAENKKNAKLAEEIAIRKERQTYNNTIFQRQIQQDKERLKVIEEALKRRKDLITVEARGNNLLDEKLKLEQRIADALDKRTQAERGATQTSRSDELREQAEKAQGYYSLFQEAAAQTSQIVQGFAKNRADKEILELDRRKERGLISEKQYQKELAKIKNEEARKDRRAAVINAFLAVPQAFLAGLLKGGPILAGVYAALATVQAAIVASAPIPKFRDGGSVAKRLGLIRGKSHEQGGVPIEVEGNEYVMNTKAVRKYGVDFMDSINNLKLSPVVTMQNKMDALKQTDYKLYEHLSTLGSYTKQGYKTAERGNDYLKQLVEQARQNKQTYV